MWTAKVEAEQSGAAAQKRSSSAAESQVSMPPWHSPATATRAGVDIGPGAQVFATAHRLRRAQRQLADAKHLAHAQQQRHAARVLVLEGEVSPNGA